MSDSKTAVERGALITPPFRVINKIVCLAHRTSDRIGAGMYVRNLAPIRPDSATEFYAVRSIRFSALQHDLRYWQEEPANGAASFVIRACLKVQTAIAVSGCC